MSRKQICSLKDVFFNILLQNSIPQYMSSYNEMHSGTRREIRASRLVTCPRKAGFGEQGFVFQFCDNQNLGQIFWKTSNLHRKPKISHFVDKNHYYGWPIERLRD
jgi:hypothetical protein